MSHDGDPKVLALEFIRGIHERASGDPTHRAARVLEEVERGGADLNKAFVVQLASFARRALLSYASETGQSIDAVLGALALEAISLDPRRMDNSSG